MRKNGLAPTQWFPASGPSIKCPICGDVFGEMGGSEAPEHVVSGRRNRESIPRAQILGSPSEGLLVLTKAKWNWVFNGPVEGRSTSGANHDAVMVE
jgi:hypothetical protein